MKKYKITVIGPIPRDHITTHRGDVIEKYGCAMHTAIGISRLLGDRGTVHMVSHVQKRDEMHIKDILSAYPNIALDALRSDADQGDVIQLKFVDQNNRLEKQTGFMNPFVPHDLDGLLDSDVFVCVPITDYELPLDTLKHIKAHSKGIVIFDAHGPTNAVSITGERFLKFWIDRDLWLPYIDVLKMNLEESHCAWFTKELGSDANSGKRHTGTAHLSSFAEHAIAHGTKALIITLDSDGSAVFHAREGKMQHELIKAIWVEHVVDTTGCGDSFAGGLGFGLLGQTTDYAKAVKYANALGAQRTQGKTFDVFKSLADTDAMIVENYGSF